VGGSGMCELANNFSYQRYLHVPWINVIPAYRQAGRAELIVLRDEKVSEGSREFRSLRIHSAVSK